MTDDRYTLTLPDGERKYDGALWTRVGSVIAGVPYVPTNDPDLLERAAAVIRQYRADHAPKPRVVEYWPTGVADLDVNYLTRHHSETGTSVGYTREQALKNASASHVAYPDTLLDTLNDLRARPTEDGR
jgi:hypothetical protein